MPIGDKRIMICCKWNYQAVTCYMSRQWAWGTTSETCHYCEPAIYSLDINCDVKCAVQVLEICLWAEPLITTRSWRMDLLQYQPYIVRPECCECHWWNSKLFWWPTSLSSTGGDKDKQKAWWLTATNEHRLRLDNDRLADTSRAVCLCWRFS